MSPSGATFLRDTSGQSCPPIWSSHCRTERLYSTTGGFSRPSWPSSGGGGATASTSGSACAGASWGEAGSGGISLCTPSGGVDCDGLPSSSPGDPAVSGSSAASSLRSWPTRDTALSPWRVWEPASFSEAKGSRSRSLTWSVPSEPSSRLAPPLCREGPASPLPPCSTVGAEPVSCPGCGRRPEPVACVCSPVGASVAACVLDAAPTNHSTTGLPLRSSFGGHALTVRCCPSRAYTFSPSKNTLKLCACPLAYLIPTTVWAPPPAEVSRW